MRATYALLAVVFLVAVCFVIISSDSEGTGDQVVVTFEEGMFVVYDDRNGPGPHYPQYMLETSPSDVDAVNHIWAIPDDEDHWDVYLNGVFHGNGVVANVGDYPSGIHFEIFRSDYSIVFNKNQGTGDSIPSITNLENGDYYDIPAISFTRAGYYATEWNTAPDGSGYSISPDNYQMDLSFLRRHYSLESNSLSLYPNWIPIQYSFTFNSNGGSGNPPGLISGRTVLTGVTIPSVNVSKIGYYSQTWNTQPDGSGYDLSPDDYEITGGFIENYFGSNISTTLYPKWVANNYSISFVMDGNGNAPNPLINFNIGSTVMIPSTIFTKTGYTMREWNSSDSGGGTSFSGGELEIDSDVITALFSEGLSAVLYSIWDPIEYSISFNGNGGTGNPPTSLSELTITTSAVIPAVNITKIGYSSTVWNTRADGHGDDFSPATRTITADFVNEYYSQSTNLVLYPKWTANKYSISFVMDGEGTSPSPLNNITIGSTISIPATTFTKTGYTMVGWNTSEDGSGGSFSGGNRTFDAELIQSLYTDGFETQLFSTWSPISYSISFGANNGTGNVPSTISGRTILTGANVPAVPFSKIGYSASVWNTSPDGTGNDIDPESNILTARSITDNFGQNTSLTLYPKWVKIRYSLSFRMDGDGTSPDPLNNFTIGSSVDIPSAEFTKRGYDMVGWNTSEDGSGIYVDSGNQMVSVEIIQSIFGSGTEARLYSIWDPKEYTVTLQTERGTVNAGPWTTDGDLSTASFTIESESIALPTPESDDRFHTFVCWTDMNGNPVSEIGSGSVGDVSLTALWESNQFSVNMIINGRTVEQSYTIESSISDPECEYGFSFVGWYYKDDDGKEVKFTEMSQMKDGLSLYAVFEPVKDNPTETIGLAAALLLIFSVAVYFSFLRNRP